MIETDYHLLPGRERGDDLLPYAVIYSLVNLENGKRYIGRTCNPKKRIYAHFNQLKKHSHKNKLLNQDSNCKFGFEILEEGIHWRNQEDKELEWMAKFKTYDERYGYNAHDPLFYVTSREMQTKRMKAYAQNEC